MAKMQKIMNKFYYDKEVGYHIGWAHHWFGYFYSCYSGVLSFIIFGIILHFWGMINRFVILFFIGIPIFICFIPADKAVFSNDIYLKYFKEFEKEDEQWHKKWKRRTWLFCIGGCLMTIVGVACMWVVLLMWSLRKLSLIYELFMYQFQNQCRKLQLWRRFSPTCREWSGEYGEQNPLCATDNEV